MLIFYNIDLHSTKDKAKYEPTYYYKDSANSCYWTGVQIFADCKPPTVTRLDSLSSFLNNNGTRIFLNFPRKYSDYYVMGYCTNYYVYHTILVKNNLVGTYLKVLNNYYIDLGELILYV